MKWHSNISVHLSLQLSISLVVFGFYSLFTTFPGLVKLLLVVKQKLIYEIIFSYKFSNNCPNFEKYRFSLAQNVEILLHYGMYKINLKYLKMLYGPMPLGEIRLVHFILWGLRFSGL